ncbi:hypothetical protein, partial [Sodalis-like endosymbiont of Proechinophthirus fluctus]|uniref:hypothetical protein n=1 Tax=Sodalis-like endosymbiont of Proechinophthirus fluctus TaxID=1462730 RepID=UPI000A44E3C0
MLYKTEGLFPNIEISASRDSAGKGATGKVSVTAIKIHRTLIHPLDRQPVSASNRTCYYSRNDSNAPSTPGAQAGHRGVFLYHAGHQRAKSTAAQHAGLAQQQMLRRPLLHNPSAPSSSRMRSARISASSMI